MSYLISILAITSSDDINVTYCIDSSETECLEDLRDTFVADLLENDVDPSELDFISLMVTEDE